MDRDKLLKALTELDFMATDLKLYLDTHPMDENAIEKYNDIAEEANKLRFQYERKYGPLTPSSQSSSKWEWINDPWPWQSKFNFDLDREDRL